MTTSDSNRAEMIEREIEADRRRIEDRIDAIQSKMSPGQLLDEALAYAKGSGGGEYVANLGNAMKTNPVPVALMGISMAWLMANPGASRSTDTSTSTAYDEEPEYPLAPVRGSVRRVGPVQMEGTSRYSHFTDEGGNRFKALTDESGRRAGHFMDSTGKTYRGFADATGRQMHDIRDEAGRLFDEASGWAARTWGRVTSSASRAGSSVMGGARSMGSGAMSAGGSMRNYAGNMNESLLKHFQDQPLIGGALAFALGAAIGAALPNTRREDEAMGEMAEGVREQLANSTSEAMHKAEEVASDVYGKAASIATDVHDTARERIAEETRTYQRPNGDARGDSRSY
ncbi:hypothetical protein REJC140_01689 [Pseudorhizobium endolithicum]|uniref:Nutrient deprivation-induced protein n=1 Tax=Pseudorhizobium endolithicum TaxID=1191678 RepID=A0ABN7JXN5_9HYPH|nr:DUF3618 domain-containing protein [Pseudorhizobium endolithicum]CAD7051145.1 hypothetical protein REJC140_01689 [Pseudorhizobium endolithicum]